MKNLTWDNIDGLYTEYEIWYKKSCEGVGVKQYPKPNVVKQKITKATFVILLLYHNLDEWVNAEEATEHYATLTGTKRGSTIQFRHTSTQHGYNMTGDGKSNFKLLNLKALPTYNAHRHVDADLTEAEWKVLKAEFKHRCATCGSKEGEVSFKRKAHYKITPALHKGHCNPNLPLSLSNCFPQCDYCNRTYQNKFYFDKEGNVKKANPNYNR